MRGRHTPTTAGSPAVAVATRAPAGPGRIAPSARRNAACWNTSHAPMANAPTSHASNHPVAGSNAGGAAVAIAMPVAKPTVGPIVAGAITVAAGSDTARIAAGTTAHAAYAADAPNPRRSGWRSASTQRIAALAARLASASTRSRSAAVMVEAIQQLAQFRDVVRGQLPVGAEVRHKRGDPTVEQALEQPLALAGHPVLPAQHRRVEVAAPVLLGADRALAQQAVEQGLDGGFLPLL